MLIHDCLPKSRHQKMSRVPVKRWDSRAQPCHGPQHVLSRVHALWSHRGEAPRTTGASKLSVAVHLHGAFVSSRRPTFGSCAHGIVPRPTEPHSLCGKRRCTPLSLPTARACNATHHARGVFALVVCALPDGRPSNFIERRATAPSFGSCVHGKVKTNQKMSTRNSVREAAV